jgi:hypothetical protein
MGAPADVQFVTTQLEAVLTGYVRRTKGVSMDSIAEALITAIDDRIQNEGDGEFPELLPSTLRRHPNRRGGQLLQDSGLLAQIQQSPGSPGPDWVEVRSPAPYAIYHVSPEPREIIPLRDFLDIDMPTVLDQIGVELLDQVT